MPGDSTEHRPRYLNHIVRYALIVAAYYLSAKLGLHVALVRGQVTPLWPPTGIAVFCLLVFGLRTWPAITLGALAVNAPLGPNALAVVAICGGNTLAPVATYAILKRCDFHLDQDRLRDALSLVFASFAGTLISSTVGTSALALSGTIVFWSTWTVWWTGDAMGMLVITPLLLVLMHTETLKRVVISRGFEGFALLAVTTAMSIAAFNERAPLIFLVFPILIWAAWRFEMTGAAPVVFVTSATAAIAAGQDIGPFAGKDLPHQMVILQTFNAATALTAYFLATMTMERNADRRTLQNVGIELERRVILRTDELSSTIERLEHSESKLREAQEIARIGHWEWRRKTDEVFWSDMMYRLWGLEPGDPNMNYDWCFEHIYPDDRVMMELAVRGASDPNKPFSYDHRVIWPDGSIHWLFAQGRAEVDQTGNVTHVFGTALDIDQRKRAENALLKLNQEAQQANNAKSDFLSRMSHELRTPLNAIVGFSSLLSYEDLSQRHREMIEMIEHSSQHLLALINEVLDISRIESGQVKLQMEPLSALGIVTEAADLVRLLCTDLGIEVRIEVDPKIQVVADPARLRQVMVNLLSNAAKYNRAGGSITVTAEEINQRIHLRVADTGHGIAMTNADDLFTPFARLGAEETTIEGTGLGLAVSKAIVDQMKGDLKIETTGPSGSVFAIDLASANAVFELHEQ